MDGPSDYYAKQNKSEKDKHCMISVTCGIWKKKWTNKSEAAVDNRELVDYTGKGWGRWGTLIGTKFQWQNKWVRNVQCEEILTM